MDHAVSHANHWRHRDSSALKWRLADTLDASSRHHSAEKNDKNDLQCPQLGSPAKANAVVAMKRPCSDANSSKQTAHTLGRFARHIVALQAVGVATSCAVSAIKTNVPKELTPRRLHSARVN